MSTWLLDEAQELWHRAEVAEQQCDLKSAIQLYKQGCQTMISWLEVDTLGFRKRKLKQLTS